MKKLRKILLPSIILIMGLSINTFAASDILLSVDGKKVNTDAAPFIENDRTLVPVRFISEALGKKVEWDNAEKKVTILDDKSEVSKIELKIESDKANLYDKNQNKKEITLDAKAKIVNDRTFVPVRFIAESLGVNVDWDNDNRVVIIGDKAKYNKDEFTKLRQIEPKTENQNTKAEQQAPKNESKDGVIGYSSVDGSTLITFSQDEGNSNSHKLLMYEYDDYNQLNYVGYAPATYDAAKNSYTVHFSDRDVPFKITEFGLLWEYTPYVTVKSDHQYNYNDFKVYEDGKLIFDTHKYFQERKNKSK